MKLSSRKILTLIAGVSFAASLVLAADAKKVDLSKLPPAADKKGVTYEKDIKPIFEKSCFKCHGPEKQKGKMRLDSLAGVIKGGENGPDVIPGKGDKSPLLHNVARIGDEDDAMPPEGKGDPLTKEQVALIRAWIDQGAK